MNSSSSKRKLSDRLQVDAPLPSIVSKEMAGGAHYYVVDGHMITSTATQLVDQFYPFDANEVLSRAYDSWKNKSDSKYYSLIQNVLSNGGDDDDARQAILDIWKTATQLGTVLHKQIEDVLNNGQVPGQASILPVEMSQFNNFISQFVDDRGLTLISAELPVAFRANSDEPWSCAGQIDALFQDENKKYYLFEWTRTSKVQISKVSLQTSIYREMLLSSKGIDVEDRMYVCQMHSDIQNFELRQCKDRKADALELLHSVDENV